MAKYQKTISNIFSTALFLICFSFVINRGIKSFQKYQAKPESVDISYKFVGELPFPSITFCPDQPNQFEKGQFPKPYDLNVLEKCNLNHSDYIKAGPWIGQGDPICENPEELFKTLTPEIEDLGKAINKAFIQIQPK